MVSALLVSGALQVGCGHTDDAPTNTASSTYISNGSSAADKIGAARMRGRQANQSQNAVPPAGGTNP